MLIGATPALAVDQRLVHLDERAERLAVGPNHRRAQLLQPRLLSFIGAETHDALQVLRGNAGASSRDLEVGAEPHLQGLLN